MHILRSHIFTLTSPLRCPFSSGDRPGHCTHPPPLHPHTMATAVRKVTTSTGVDRNPMPANSRSNCNHSARAVRTVCLPPTAPKSSFSARLVVYTGGEGEVGRMRRWEGEEKKKMSAFRNKLLPGCSKLILARISEKTAARSGRQGLGDDANLCSATAAA